jgi:hypothetical protein
VPYHLATVHQVDVTYYTFSNRFWQSFFVFSILRAICPLNSGDRPTSLMVNNFCIF